MVDFPFIFQVIFFELFISDALEIPYIFQSLLNSCNLSIYGYLLYNRKILFAWKYARAIPLDESECIL